MSDIQGWNNNGCTFKQCTTCYKNTYSLDYTKFVMVGDDSKGVVPRTFNDGSGWYDVVQDNNGNGIAFQPSYTPGAYMGIISANCTSTSYQTMDPGGIGDGPDLSYKLMWKNSGTFTNIVGKCMPKNINAPIGDCQTNHNNIYIRDWDALFANHQQSDTSPGRAVECCTRFSDDATIDDGRYRSDDKTMTLREALCPNELYVSGKNDRSGTGIASNQCMNIMSAYCSVPKNWIPSIKDSGKPTIRSICSDYMDRLNPLEPQYQPMRSSFFKAMNVWNEDNIKKIDKNTSLYSLIKKDPITAVIVTNLNKDSIKTRGGLLINDICKNITKQDISDDIKDTGLITKLCACYLPPSEYPLKGLVPKECNSICNIVSNGDIPIGDQKIGDGLNVGNITGLKGFPIYEYTAKGFVAKNCKQTSCIIDNVSMNIVRSQVGKIDFRQLCSNTNGGNVTCLMDNMNINITDSTVDNSVFQQSCKSCSVLDSNGVVTGKCDGKNTPSSGSKDGTGTGIDNGTTVQLPDSTDYSWTGIYDYIIHHYITIIIVAIAIIIAFLCYSMYSSYLQNRIAKEEVTSRYGDYQNMTPYQLRLYKEQKQRKNIYSRMMDNV